jgi:hypothetical protein
MSALMDFLNAELSGPDVYDLGRPTGDDTDSDPCFLGKLDPVAVSHVKGLGLVSMVVQGDPSVGHHAVYVEDKQFYFFCLRLNA